VLVQTGTLKVGEIVSVGRTWGRVRALNTAAGKRVKEAGPATAVEIIGLQGLPEAGDILRVVADEKTARDAAETAETAATATDGRGGASLEDISAQIQASEVAELRVVLKTDVQGSLGAIRHSLERLNTNEVRINILREGAGDINESDVNLASASDAVVIGFNTKLDALSESLAQQHQLVADASHEFRSPLATVRINVEVLTRGDELAPATWRCSIRDTVARSAS
jgi:translation initiation factor IF-2